jgi:hypothetical protein
MEENLMIAMKGEVEGHTTVKNISTIKNKMGFNGMA